MKSKPLRHDTRDRVVQAALAILRRDGLDAVTVSAVSQETGIVPRDLTFYFPERDDVVRAVFDNLLSCLSEVLKLSWQDQGASRSRAGLSDHVLVAREVIQVDDNVMSAVVDLALRTPDLLSLVRGSEERAMALLRKRSGTPDLDLVRFFAARGLAASSVLGICPLSDPERNRLFDFIEDDTVWSPPHM